jgi:hypothetical protein
MEIYVFPTIGQCATMTTTFDLWMLRLSYDIFALVVNLPTKIKFFYHITIGLFKAFDTFGVTLVE